jgi:hypothetical protein
MEPEGQLQDPAYGTYPDPRESNPCCHILVLLDKF